MAKVTAVLATSPAVLPAGVLFGQYKYTILAADGLTVVQSMLSTATSVTFASDVPAGSYTASAVAVDSAGADLGTAVSVAFTVPAAATFDAPTSVTVTLS